MIRPSAMPRFFECPSSAMGGDYHVASSSDSADLGTAVHVVAQAVVHGQEIELCDAADRMAVDLDELRSLYWAILSTWTRVSQHFLDARTEYQVSGTVTSGTADVVSIGDVYRILDWKSGRVERSHKHQLLAYAHSLVCQHGDPPSGVVQCVEAWLRTREIVVYDVSVHDIEAFERDYLSKRKQIGDVYSPGEACSFCPLRNTCVARQDWIRAAVASLTTVPPEAIAPSDLAAAYDKIKAIEDAAASYKLALRQVLEDGDQPMPDGRYATLEEQKRGTIHLDQARPILREWLSDAEIDASCSVTAKAIDDAIGTKAPPRGKGKLIAKVHDSLLEKGAKSIYSSKRIAIKRGV